ncbi:DUF6122 family protein [Maribacter sp. 4G9]|uniref:DUF6122 family protein n=1 Tax=Maribacter sp. 4G9 TaxID=1889777 RepID=UPI000C14F3A6|nr:DUF6122 family protein [Maribacter sp. 4G9]PIB38812.1 hypothetical protein BFP75_14380 [Maribacter sp. 4G9]
MLRFTLHYGIHFIVPLLVAFLFFKEQRLKVGLILLAGILLDLDHLLATPVFDADRCSINFHPLHTYWAMGIYFLMLFWKTTRIWGIAFLIHMVADITDCLFVRSNL